MSSSLPEPHIEQIDIDALKPHEAVKPGKARHFSRFASRKRSVRTKPILIDAETRVILDGHHRWWVCKRLGMLTVPCCLVDYLHDDRIQVLSRKKDIAVTKEDVIRMGTSGKTFPPKTTKHVYAYAAMERMVELKNVRSA